MLLFRQNIYIVYSWLILSSSKVCSVPTCCSKCVAECLFVLCWAISSLLPWRQGSGHPLSGWDSPFDLKSRAAGSLRILGVYFWVRFNLPASEWVPVRICKSWRDGGDCLGHWEGGCVVVQGFLEQDVNMARQCREHTGMSKTSQTTNKKCLPYWSYLMAQYLNIY